MKQLNIQDRKLSVIEQLIIINDDKVFKQVEDIINTSLNRPQLKKFSRQELIERAEKSNKNIEKGEVYSQKDLEKMAKV